MISAAAKVPTTNVTLTSSSGRSPTTSESVRSPRSTLKYEYATARRTRAACGALVRTEISLEARAGVARPAANSRQGELAGAAGRRFASYLCCIMRPPRSAAAAGSCCST